MSLVALAKKWDIASNQTRRRRTPPTKDRAKQHRRSISFDGVTAVDIPPYARARLLSDAPIGLTPPFGRNDLLTLGPPGTLRTDIAMVRNHPTAGCRSCFAQSEGPHQGPVPHEYRDARYCFDLAPVHSPLTTLTYPRPPLRTNLAPHPSYNYPPAQDRYGRP